MTRLRSGSVRLAIGRRSSSRQRWRRSIMPRVEPFYVNCSSENCETVTNQVMGSYDRKAHRKKPIAHMKGGLDTSVLEPAHIPIKGETGRYVVAEHGVSIQFRRCYEFDYVDKFTHKQESDTCTEKHVVNIPQRVFNCYNTTSDLLTQMRKGKKGRPGINYKVLAMVACSKSGVSPTRVSEPMSPAIVGLHWLKPVRREEGDGATREVGQAGDRQATEGHQREAGSAPAQVPEGVRRLHTEREGGAQAGWHEDGVRQGVHAHERVARATRGAGIHDWQGVFRAQEAGQAGDEEVPARSRGVENSHGYSASRHACRRPTKIKRAPKKELARYELEQALGVHL